MIPCVWYIVGNEGLKEINLGRKVMEIEREKKIR